MQQSLGQNQIGQSPQMVQQSLVQQHAQQQMAQSQITQQQIAQSQLAQQQLAQSQLAQQQQQQLAQSQMAQQQQQIAQSQMAQQQLAQQQIAQSQLAQQQMGQSQLVQQQLSQPQIIQQQVTQPQMIQQQLAQQQINQQINQQQLQQMMYCPTVRLVYDTPMQLMQSGDQIQQQNQNIYVNQPPWSRPVQNQVIYVQQIGSNLVPVQHIDPNMFLQQNIPMYQQVVQNVPQLVQNLPQTVQTLPQGQIRQIINNIPAGMMQNFGTNVQRVQDPNLGQMVQNFGLVQANNDVTMNNVNLANNEVDRQTVTNQVNGQQNAPTQELMHVYRQVVPQVNQQIIRTQIPVSQQNNLQNFQTVGQQIVTNMGQTVGSSVRTVSNVGISTQPGLKMNNIRSNTTQIAPNPAPMNQINRTTSSPITTATANNVGTNTQLRNNIIQAQNANMVPYSQQNIPNLTPAMQSYGTSVGTLNTVTYSAVRNGQPYTYRAIQPKPNGNNNIRVNFKPRASQMNMVKRPTAPSALNASNNNPNIPVSTNSTPACTNYIKMETDSPTFNKKRKSESPDEVLKKVSNYGSITVTAQVKDKIKAKYATTSEVGVNTSPVHKLHKFIPTKPENQLPVLQINPMDAKIKQEILSPTTVPVNSAPGLNNGSKIDTNMPIKTEPRIDKNKTDSNDINHQTEEKLVRKTVFPQAKSTGRLLDAKAGLDMPKIDEPTNNVNILNNEIIQGPLISDEARVAKIINNVSKEIQRTTQANCKQNTTVTEKIKTEETKVVKNTSPTKNSNIKTPDAIVETEKPIKALTKMSKPSDNNMKIEPSVLLEPKKAVVIFETAKQSKGEPQPAVAKNSEGLQSETIEKVPVKENAAVKENIPANLDAEKLVEVPKIEAPVAVTKIATESDFEQAIKDNKIEKKEYKNISINDIKGKEIHIVDGNIHREERDFVLTHVLDGFVIQESNVPFAIRRPLKEKTVNAYVQDKNDPCIKAAKDEIRGHILELSQLHINESRERERGESETRLKENDEEDNMNKEEDTNKEEDEQMTIETTEPAENSESIETKEEPKSIETKKVVEIVEHHDVTKDNPFESLEQSIVKSWTVDDLAAYLTKYNWTETVSTLQHHEIDGESLFLVSKTQLVAIGLNETHADVICEFVGSKNKEKLVIDAII